MSDSKRLLEEELERVETICPGCQDKTTAQDCVRCGESFQRCEPCTGSTQCDYCEHMTTKDD